MVNNEQSEQDAGQQIPKEQGDAGGYPETSSVGNEQVPHATRSWENQTAYPGQSYQPTDTLRSSASVKPNIPQWGTFIWGVILTGVAAVTLWWLLTGQGEWWSFLLLLDENQRVIVPTVVIGALLILLGIFAFIRRKP